MPLELLPLEEADFPAYAKLAKLISRGDFNNRMYPNGYGPGHTEYYIDRVRFKYNQTDNQVRFNKVVDTSLPDDDEYGKIISIAEWSFYASERSDEELSEQAKALKDLGYAPGVNQAMSDAFFGKIKQTRRSVWGGKPHVLLQILVTAPGHERRGAGSRQLEWGITAADELGLPVWVEATLAGRPLYERFGCRMVSRLDFDAKAWGVVEDFSIVNMLRPSKDRFAAMPNPIKVGLPSILVLGAGELGIGVLKALAAYPAVSTGATKVAVLLRPGSDSAANVRSISSAFSILSENLATATAETLADIFKLFDGIICCTGFAGGPGTQRKITQAVRLAGQTSRAERIRYIPWQFGVDYDVFGRSGRMELWDEQLDVRDMLRSPEWPVSVTWTIVSTGIFTSFLFEEDFGIVRGLKGSGPVTVEAIGGRHNQVTSTDVEDIGRITAEVLFDAATSNQVVYTAGQTHSYSELRDEVAAIALGREVRMIEKTVSELEEELALDPQNAYKKYRVVFAEGRGVSWDMSLTWNARNGIRTNSILNWWTKYIDVAGK